MMQTWMEVPLYERGGVCIGKFPKAHLCTRCVHANIVKKGPHEIQTCDRDPSMNYDAITCAVSPLSTRVVATCKSFLSRHLVDLFPDFDDGDLKTEQLLAFLRSQGVECIPLGFGVLAYRNGRYFMLTYEAGEYGEIEVWKVNTDDVVTLIVGGETVETIAFWTYQAICEEPVDFDLKLEGVRV